MDGWLGFLVGSELWYPLFEASHVVPTTASVSKLILGETSSSKPGVKSFKAMITPAKNLTKILSSRHSSSSPLSDTSSSSSLVEPSVALPYPSPPTQLPSMPETLLDSPSRDDSRRAILAQSVPHHSPGATHHNYPDGKLPDYITAWSYLQDTSNALYPKSLLALMEDLKLESGEDLEQLSDNLLICLSATLKPAPKARFIDSLHKYGITVVI